MATLITSVIRPHALEGVKNALKAMEITGMTASEVKGFGRQGGQTETYRGAEYKIDFLPKIKLEIIVSDELVEKAISTIVAAAGSGKIGDGKIWTIPLGSLTRIRTSEMGDEAI
ncbi:MAG: P-II family nitrogen regulator [Acidimicrobiales bacterium]